MRGPSSRNLLIPLLWLVALGGALALDRTAAEWVHAHQLDAKRTWSPAHRRTVEAAKALGTYPLTLGVALVASLTHPLRWRAGAFIALAGVASGVNGLLKWVVGRRRPVVEIDPLRFDPFPGGLRGMIFQEKNLCFPSGHTCLAFATATALSLLFPRGRFVFYGLAVVVGIERVTENAHYVSDTVAGALLGVVAAYVVKAIVDAMGRRAEQRGFDVATGLPDTPG